MKFDLIEATKEKILVVAHRGSAGGNIPCNTIAAYENALRQGADMIEVDLEMTADGHLVIFHPGMEPAHLKSERHIPEMTLEEVRELRYVNCDRVPTQFGVEMFDDVLETFRNRCFINVDKFWGHPAEIAKAIRRHGMSEQMLVKSAPSDDVVKVLSETAPEIAYMPIIRGIDGTHEKLMESNIRYIGCEILFFEDSEPQVSPDFIAHLHRDGKLAWGNSIIYNCKKQIAAGHSDDTAICGDPENSWGWLADHGFDVIQTDWPILLINYLKSTGKYYK